MADGLLQVGAVSVSPVLLESVGISIGQGVLSEEALRDKIATRAEVLLRYTPGDAKSIAREALDDQEILDTTLEYFKMNMDPLEQEELQRAAESRQHRLDNPIDDAQEELKQRDEETIVGLDGKGDNA